MKCPRCSGNLKKEISQFKPNGSDLFIGEELDGCDEVFDVVTDVYQGDTFT